MKRKIIISTILLFILIGVSVGYYLFNKGPVDVKNSAAEKITATGLYERFSNDSAKALKKYAGRVMLVSGKVAAVSVNLQKNKVILLATDTEGAYVNCTLEEDPGNIREGSLVNIKGICSGIGQGDEDLGIKADVYLTGCFLIK